MKLLNFIALCCLSSLIFATSKQKTNGKNKQKEFLKKYSPTIKEPSALKKKLQNLEKKLKQLKANYNLLIVKIQNLFAVLYLRTFLVGLRSIFFKKK